MKPYYQQGKWAIYHGDCREVLPTLSKASAIVTDPPYELGFMGKSWDSKGISFQKETWEIIRQACLLGAMLLSFGGTRTFHRIACAIEDAGWEIRDTVMWVYGSGFPKSLDISKAIDYDACREQLTEKLGRKPTKDELKEAWVEFRKITGHYLAPDGQWRDCNNHKPNEEIRNPETHYGYKTSGFRPLDSPTTPEAQLWNGYGTALKPAYEPIILAMNPLDGTFANNALKHGVAGLNIDECRIGFASEADKKESTDKNQHADFNSNDGIRVPTKGIYHGDFRPPINYNPTKGRFPANFIHDGSQMVMELFPETKSGNLNIGHKRGKTEFYGGGIIQRDYGGDNGSAARFFYVAKASKAERDRGLEGLEARQYSYDGRNKPIENPYQRNNSVARNNHPTVKPLALMTYLVKLVKMPEHNLIIDPFMGSGTTLLACIRLGIPCIGIDNDEKSCEIAAKRCSQEVKELV